LICKQQNKKESFYIIGYLLELIIEFGDYGFVLFRAYKVLHCTMKNQGGNQYGMAFFQKTHVLNHLKSLKG